MMRKIIWTNQFKKEYKLAIKRGLPIDELDDIIRLLASGHPLPEKHRDHALSNNWAGHRECHVRPNWLLIYKDDSKHLILTLTRTGSHSDLLEK